MWVKLMQTYVGKLEGKSNHPSVHVKKNTDGTAKLDRNGNVMYIIKNLPKADYVPPELNELGRCAVFGPEAGKGKRKRQSQDDDDDKWMKMDGQRKRNWQVPDVGESSSSSSSSAPANAPSSSSSSSAPANASALLPANEVIGVPDVATDDDEEMGESNNPICID
jgi:hypothetical protein